MAKLLLTSSQVQVIASGLVVILCTFALFFSGYIIQQRTLNELRSAIQPRSIPGGAQRHRVSSPSPYAHAYLPEQFREKKTQLDDGTIIIEESQADRDAREQLQLVGAGEPASNSKSGKKILKKAGKDLDFQVNQNAKQENINIVEQLKAKVKAKMAPASEPDAAVKNEKPLTRAQRRKMIKQDLQRSAQAEDGLYYQRRMW
ncbi:hypothetical protein BGZ63DRAFT_39164 [Mariannaea sp. PMI_226]|nr:hypothetical protein BGZ63DRAFT_39164 [Mariannaea sp. PMI_226]